MTNLLPRLEFLAQSVFRSDTRCPHCRSRTTTVVARKYVVVRVRRCQACFLYFTDPIYRPGVARSLYDRLYSGEGSTTRMPAPAELERLRRDGFAGTDKDFGERIRRIRRAASGARLLEIGSSWGYFLMQAESLGFDATGVEIGEPRRAFGERQLGLRIVRGLDELAEEQFDVVYTSHVLEHFQDLSTVFAEVERRLAPGGILVAEVPRLAFETRGRGALSVIGAVHPLGFTDAFFRENLPRFGFRLRGLYDDWSAFPHEPADAKHAQGSRSSGQIICMAEKLARAA